MDWVTCLVLLQHTINYKTHNTKHTYSSRVAKENKEMWFYPSSGTIFSPTCCKTAVSKCHINLYIDNTVQIQHVYMEEVYHPLFPLELGQAALKH